MIFNNNYYTITCFMSYVFLFLENQNVTFRVSSTGSNPKRCRCKHEPVQMVKWTCKLMKGMADAIQLSKPRRHILLTGQPGIHMIHLPCYGSVNLPVIRR